MTGDKTRTLTHILDALDEAAEGRSVSVQDVLDSIGDRSIMPVVVAICVLLVSPLSGIPGVPTVSSLVIVTMTAQALVGRRHLWLPLFLREREVKARRLQSAIDWMRKPCAWIDRHSHPRLRLLTVGPMRWLALFVCVAIPVSWPFLELLPMVTSIGAASVGLMAFGLLTRDGLYVVTGYASVGALVGVIVWLA